jgi:hypothetical protein
VRVVVSLQGTRTAMPLCNCMAACMVYMTCWCAVWRTLIIQDDTHAGIHIH